MYILFYSIVSPDSKGKSTHWDNNPSKTRNEQLPQYPKQSQPYQILAPLSRRYKFRKHTKINGQIASHSQTHAESQQNQRTVRRRKAAQESKHRSEDHSDREGKLAANVRRIACDTPHKGANYGAKEYD